MSLDLKTINDSLNTNINNITNAKTNLVGTIGAPSLTTDTWDTINTNVQNSKNTLATNLGTLGVSANGTTDSIDSLATKVGTVTKLGADTQASKVVVLQNLVTNGNIESGVFPNYAGNGGTLTTDTSTYKFGSQSAKFVTTANGDDFILVAGGTTTVGSTTTVYPVAAGHIMYICTYAKTDGIQTIALRPIAFNSSGVVVQDAMQTITNPTSWTFKSCNYTMPVGSTCLMLRLQCAGTGSAWTDGICLIDLTVSYGAGSEPTQTQMDTLMTSLGGYFDGTAVVEKIPSGVFNINGTTGGPEIVTANSSLISANIKSGTSVFGVPGKASVVETSDATAAVGDMRTEKTGYVNGTKITGNLPTWGNNPSNGYEMQIGVSTSGGNVYLLAPKGIYDQNTWITYSNDQNCVAANIKSGVSILGVIGTGPKYGIGSTITDMNYTATQTFGSVAYTTSANSQGAMVKVDSSGNTYMTFNNSSPATYGSIKKCNSLGSQVWYLTDLAYANGIDVDSSGNVYVCSGTSTSGQKLNRRLNSSGTETWSMNATVSIYGGWGATADSSGNMYFSNYSGLFKYNSAGTQVWNAVSAYPRDIKLDSSGNIFGAGNNNTLFKVNSSGTIVNNPSAPAGAYVAVDSNGYIYFSGTSGVGGKYTNSLAQVWNINNNCIGCTSAGDIIFTGLNYNLNRYNGSGVSFGSLTLPGTNNTLQYVSVDSTSNPILCTTLTAYALQKVTGYSVITINS